jgi:hypothetical protein
MLAIDLWTISEDGKEGDKIKDIDKGRTSLVRNHRNAAAREACLGAQHTHTHANNTQAEHKHRHTNTHQL